MTNENLKEFRGPVIILVIVAALLLVFGGTRSYAAGEPESFAKTAIVADDAEDKVELPQLLKAEKTGNTAGLDAEDKTEYPFLFKAPTHAGNGLHTHHGGKGGRGK
jgi:hypothetical protein